MEPKDDCLYFIYPNSCTEQQLIDVLKEENANLTAMVSGVKNASTLFENGEEVIVSGCEMSIYSGAVK